MARSYANPGYRTVHQLIVDAYAVQHPGGRSRRDIQGIALSLMTLCLFIESDADPRAGPELQTRIIVRRLDFRWLEPPPLHDRMTVADVLPARSAAEHQRLANDWARQMWQAWTPHHAVIRAWNAQALSVRDQGRANAGPSLPKRAM